MAYRRDELCIPLLQCFLSADIGKGRHDWVIRRLTWAAAISRSGRAHGATAHPVIELSSCTRIERERRDTRRLAIPLARFGQNAVDRFVVKAPRQRTVVVAALLQ